MICLIYTLTVLSLLFCPAAVYCACTGRTAASWRWFGACWLASAGLFVCNAVMAQAVPFGNMRHVLCFFPLVLLPAGVWIRRREGFDLCAPFAVTAAVALIGALCMPMQASWRQMPALQSPWFAPHVTSYVIAYGLMTVAALLALRADEKRAQLAAAADAVVRFAFPFMTFGLWSGALWADEAWGRYWAWDIKEVWALLTWCVYLIYFHLPPSRRNARRLLLLVGFAAVVITFIVVNFMPAAGSLHTYSM